MLKTISAALLAVSVLAAPAMAAKSGKATQTTTQAPTVKAAQVKPNALNAHAGMGRHHARHFRHHHFHKKMGALKTHQASSIKHVAPATKRS
jgi:Ni/Co efflux regulator RcnB